MTDPTAAVEAPPRYVVGIDLGTTNCALAFVDTEAGDAVETWAVPQFVAPATVEGRENLPSFLYRPADGEFPPGSLSPPWAGGEPPAWVAGAFARDHGSNRPGRQVASAKSWLCHPGVDRTADLLPWHAADGVERISPVAASAALLSHLRSAWDAAHPGFPLAEQDVVLTLPASFDEVARELTVRAAKAAGLPRVVPIEEPQAAFYAWLARHPADWRDRVRPDTNVLVCDIGGGTSDFTLIRVKAGGGDGDDGGKVSFHRVAVGEHLILGGDNLDLALAHHFEERLKAEGTSLTPRQWDVLVARSRRAKEELLSGDAPDRVAVTLPGAGSKLVAGGLTVACDRDAARDALLGGFLPDVPVDAVPEERVGFREVGLPYAADAAITKHLARFLSSHGAVAGAADGEPAKPDAVLFNGGFFASPVLRDTLLGRIAGWFGGDFGPEVLEHDRLDLAVSRGAAYFGQVRRGRGVRVEAGLARSYYLGAEGGDVRDAESGDRLALCVIPAGTRPGEAVPLPDVPVAVRVGRPIELPLYSSGTRLTDAAGSVHAVDPTAFTALPPIRTVLKARGNDGDELPAVLEAGLTELGTLDLAVRERTDGARAGKRWSLSFDVRSTTRTDLAAHAGEGEAAGVVDDDARGAVAGVLYDCFGAGDLPPKRVNAALVEAAGLPREEWPPTLLRSVWETLLDLEPGRRRSPAHESRWLNLLGYALRPGYGVALDDWRCAETWRRLHGRLVHHDPAVVSQSHVLWRRVCGGLEAGQQQALAEPLVGTLKGGGKRGAGPDPEAVRLLGSLERLTAGAKADLGRRFLTLAVKESNDGRRAVLWWAVGRTGARVPLYGPANRVVPAETAADWFDQIGRQSKEAAEPPVWPVVQLARRTGDRFLDLPTDARNAVLQWLAEVDAPPHWRDLVKAGGRLSHEEEGLAFGESLPAGLRLT